MTPRSVPALAALALTACSARPHDLAERALVDSGHVADAGSDAPAESVPGACAGRSPGVYCGARLGLGGAARYACSGGADAVALAPCDAACVSSSPPGNDHCELPCAGDAAACAVQTSAPVRVHAAAGDGFALVRWTATAPALHALTVRAQPGGASLQLPADATGARVPGLANGTSYTFTVTADEGAPSTASNPVVPQAGATLIEDVVYHAQERRSTCEAASLRMALEHAGKAWSEPEVVDALGTDGRAGYVSDGVLHWGNPYAAFVGSPDGSESAYTGYGTYWPTVARAATSLGGTVLRGGEGIPAGDVYDAVRRGHPAVVWIAGDLAYHAPIMQWVAFDGMALDWHGPIEHAALVVGVGDGNVVVDNPNHGEWQSIAERDFENAYETFGGMAVIIE